MSFIAMMDEITLVSSITVLKTIEIHHYVFHRLKNSVEQQQQPCLDFPASGYWCPELVQQGLPHLRRNTSILP
jgi:hypothetical protein